MLCFLSSLNYLLQDVNIIFQKDVDSFEIEHKTCFFLGGGSAGFSFARALGQVETQGPQYRYGLGRFSTLGRGSSNCKLREQTEHLREAFTGSPRGSLFGGGCKGAISTGPSRMDEIETTS